MGSTIRESGMLVATEIMHKGCPDLRQFFSTCYNDTVYDLIFAGLNFCGFHGCVESSFNKFFHSWGACHSILTYLQNLFNTTFESAILENLDL